MDDFLTRMQNIDRRIIYTVVFIVLAVPMFKPMGLPLKITRETKASYDAIEALPEGALVMFATANAPGTQAELEPQSIAVVKHLMRKNAKIVFNPVAAESPRYCDRYREMMAAAGFEEGVDFIQLPYQAGGETLYVAMGTDLKSAYVMIQPGQYELWDSIDGMQDFDLFVDCGGGETQRWAIGHIEAKYHIPHITLITAVILAVVQPYFTSRQFSGIVSGLNGAAEYEVLAGFPGLAASGMDAQSLGHLWVIFTIVLGNVAYFITKAGKAAKARGGGD